MSFIDPNAFYEEELLLLDKGQDTPTPITDGQVVNGDLVPFRHRMEAVNTGNQLQNNGVLTLRIPPDGTFIRKEPILIDETAKDDYIIQFRIKQDRDKDGVFEEEGKLFRFFIGQPTIQDDEHGGETLKINLIPVEYRTRETIDAERLEDGGSDRRDPFQTPKGAFERRALAYNTIKGFENTGLIFTTGPTGSIKLPDADSLRQEYRPLAPTTTHDLFRDIVARQSLAGVQGGVFEDFFFDYDAIEGSTSNVLIKAEAEGTIDRGVILDPLTFDTADTEKDKTINVDLIKFKNNVIAQGNPQGGSLPREHTVFSSIFEHAKLRQEWSPTKDYGSGGTGSQTEPNQSEVRITDTLLGEIRFFKAIQDSGPSAGGAVNPLDAVNRTAKWEEDFVTIPPFTLNASYNKDDIVTQTEPIPNDSNVKFYKAIEDIDPNDPLGDPNTNPKWGFTGRSFTDGFEHPLFNGASPEGLARAGRTKFFSYTPWTADFEAMRQSSLFGVENGTQESNFESAGYQGVVPDWNYVRANFDRVEADSRFELVAGKDVQKVVSQLNDISVGDRHFGNRWQIGSNFVAPVFSTHKSQIAEWVGADFKTGSIDIDNDLRFSRDPLEGETIIDRSRGVWLVFNSTLNQWGDLWNIIDDGDGGPVDNSLLQQIAKGLLGVLIPAVGIIINSVRAWMDTDKFGSSGTHSPLHICRDIKLVEGASGIPGQAFEMRYDWSAVESVDLPNGITIPIQGADRKNFSSVGAWWFMQFPYPKIEGFGREVGDQYKNPFIDSNNLNKNSKGVFGWNEGLDSEDLGRIQRVSFKVRLSLFGSVTGDLVIGFSEMPLKFWAIDIFDRVWYGDFKARRNGEYNLVQLSFGENSIQQLHFGRYDELLELFGIILDTNWALKEKEFTGVEFDWRFVKSMGMFYNIAYNSQGLYVGNQFIDYAKNIAEQTAGQAVGLIASAISPQENYNPTDILINNARLAVDELRFEKQLYANSDRTEVSDARTELTHLASEVDYLNLRIKAQATRERSKFVEQAWFMQAHGDVRVRFGEKFTAEGPRVPNVSQDLICNEVKHIIDSDGYMMQITGKRKFIFT